jgi:hypothetical protein
MIHKKRIALEHYQAILTFVLPLIVKNISQPFHTYLIENKEFQDYLAN